MRIVAVVAGTLGLLCATAANAQTTKQIRARYSQDYKQCLATGDAANGVTIAIMDCNGFENDRQDARLNQAYRMVMARLSSQKKAVLRASERNWIVQRDLRCRRKSAVEEGGSLARIIYSDCFLEETIRRTIWLEFYKG